MSSSAAKRRKLGPDQEFEEITAAEYEEDLASILSRIQQHEDSEALARQLELQWNDIPSTSANVGNGNETDAIVILDSDDDETDEEMARRLAQEWDAHDNLIQPSLPASSTSSSRLDTPVSTKRRLPTGLDIPPDEKLLEYRPLFIQERSCPKCNELVESPRGLVIRLYHHLPHSLTQS
jgi:baculoviral IAP repeat-containing protein 6